MIRLPQCYRCKHRYEQSKRPGRLTCEAFPDGIPLEIRLNKHDHKEPYPGDNDIRFEWNGYEWGEHEKE